MSTLSLSLTDSERLAIQGELARGHDQDETPIVYPPLSRAALCGNVPRAPRGGYYAQDEEEGDVSPDLDNGDEDESPRERDVIPSRSSRGRVTRELKAMDFDWE